MIEELGRGLREKSKLFNIRKYYARNEIGIVVDGNLKEKCRD